MTNADGLPDLLRRFTATPYRFAALLHTTVITFETNDHKMLAAFEARSEELAGALMSFPGRQWHCKIVRDFDVSNKNDEPYLINTQTLSTLFLGTGTFLGIDWQQGELLGFVAADLSSIDLLDALITVAQQHHLTCECRAPEKLRYRFNSV